MMRVKINCGLFKNYSVSEITTAKKGIKLLEDALNSEEFRYLILAAKFENTKDTSIQILDKILSGSDYLDPRIDYEINFNLVMFSRWWSRVVGYVLDGDRTIYTNRKFFPKEEWTAVYFASNILHEYCHLIGYSHRSASDYNSVPYKMNTLLENFYSR